ncbi:SH3 domain-containing protein [Ectopseudomonas mendocina]|uniref:SH3 domain-containing protein n=1 Tax=Ectopseudomonas mendocina TaxID=300 RepID=UPI0024478EB6|nr:SH3 domain-containing protein [Pseudomonas chengduensis]MDH1869263.1 SH3 domain-containing protein [Pseudomonas chengduensis]
MKNDSGDGDVPELRAATDSGLGSIFSVANVGAGCSVTQMLTERASTQLAMAAIVPLDINFSPAIAAASASVSNALKPTMAMQSVLERIRPFTEVQSKLLPLITLGADFRERLVGLAHVGQVAKQLASVKPLLNTSALVNTASIRHMLDAIESLRGPSLMATELAALATASSFKNYSKMAELASMGSPLLKAARLTELEDIEWDAPASSRLLSTIAAAAETLREAPLPALPLTDLPDASNDVDGGYAPTPQQLQGELADAAATGDLSKLSPAAKAFFKWFCWFIGVMAAYIATQNAVREELCFMQPKLMPGMTTGQMGKTVRRAMCSAAFIPDGDFRFVRGEGVRLRGEPGTKAEILPVHLVDGQIIEVLDTSDPDWLHVVVVAGGSEGWVSRKYTRKITLN